MDRAAERAKMRAMRKAYVASLGKAANLEAQHTLAQLAAPQLKPYKFIASYRAIGSEMDPAPLEVLLRLAGHIIALPQVVDRDTPLNFARYEPGDRLEPGPVGAIPQPLGSAPQLRPDALLVPLLAVDTRGYRLGQGAGHYDRTIAARKPIFTLGLAYECQIIAGLAQEPWDEPLDAIVTDKQWVTYKDRIF